MTNDPVLCKSGSDPPDDAARETRNGTSPCVKRLAARIGKHLLLFIGKTGLSFLAAWIASGPLIKAAAAERGYEGAYGGEWLLIIAVFVAVFYALSRGIRHSRFTKKA